MKEKTKNNQMNSSVDPIIALQFIIDNDMINFTDIENQINMKKRQDLLAKHEFKVWKGKDNLWYTYFSDPSKTRGRTQRRRNSLEELQDVIVAHYEAIENEPSVKEVFQQWNDSRLEYGEIEKQSYDRYASDFERFFSKTELHNKKIRVVTENELEEFIRKCIYEKNLSSKAFSGLKSILCGVYKYAKKHKWTEISITSFLGDLDFSKKAFKRVRKTDEELVFNDQEVEMITDYINKNIDLVNLGILLCFQTGLRRGELCALQWKDFHDKISKIDKTEAISSFIEINKTEIRYRNPDGHYVYEVRDSAKTDAGNRNVVVSSGTANIIKMIREYNAEGGSDEYLFLENGERIRAYTFERRINKICKDLGIPHRTMHSVRKTYATKLLNAGVDERIIINQMGHTNISCTRDFYFFNNKNAEDVAMQIEAAVSY